MCTVIQLGQERHIRRKKYLKANQARLERFFSQFVATHFTTDYHRISEQYMSIKANQNELAWDYADFRDDLKDAIGDAFGDVMWSELSETFWFDSRWLNRDELVDRCTSFFILGESAVANQR